MLELPQFRSLTDPNVQDVPMVSRFSHGLQAKAKYFYNEFVTYPTPSYLEKRV